MTYNKRLDYVKDYGAKATIVSETFKENENNGKSIKDTQVELLLSDVVKSKMLHSFTKNYIEHKDKIGWI